MPAAAVIGGIASIAGGVAAGIGTLAGGLMVAGGVATVAGAVTGNKTLTKIGAVASLAGGGISVINSIKSGGGLFGGGASAASSAAGAASSALGMEGALGSGISAAAPAGLAEMGGGAGLSMAGAAGGAISQTSNLFANALPAAAATSPAMEAFGGLGSGLEPSTGGTAVDQVAKSFANAPPVAAPDQPSGGIQPNLPSLTQPAVTPPGVDSPSSFALRDAYGGSSVSPAESVRQETAQGGLLRSSNTSAMPEGMGIRPPPGMTSQTPMPGMTGGGVDATAELQTAADGGVYFRNQKVYDPRLDATKPMESVKQKIESLGGIIRKNADLIYILNSAVGMAYRNKAQAQQQGSSAALEDLYRARAESERAQTAYLQAQQQNANSIPNIPMTATGASPFGGQYRPLPTYMQGGLLRAR